MACASCSKMALDLGPGTWRRSPIRPCAPPWVAIDTLAGEVTSSMKSAPHCGHRARPTLETLRQVVRDRPCSTLAISGVARPGADVHDHRLAVRLNNRVPAENLESQCGGRGKSCLAQRRGFERVAQHALIAMIEPLKPAAVDRQAHRAHAVELDEVARHMLLRNDEGDAAPGKYA